MKRLKFLLCGICVLFSQTIQADCDCDCDNNFYIGVDGGFAFGLVQSRSDFDPGNAITITGSTTFDAHIGAGFHVGANAGYWLRSNLRADISYSYMRVPLTWVVQFAFPDPEFSSDFYTLYDNCHLVLGNAYYHLNNFFVNDYSPYISGGVGVAFNAAGKTDVRFRQGQLGAHLNPYTNTNFAARFGVGLMKPFCGHALDMGFNFLFIGAVKTGETLLGLNGFSGIVEPNRHHMNWVGTFYVGFKYGL